MVVFHWVLVTRCSGAMPALKGKHEAGGLAWVYCPASSVDSNMLLLEGVAPGTPLRFAGGNDLWGGVLRWLCVGSKGWPAWNIFRAKCRKVSQILAISCNESG